MSICLRCAMRPRPSAAGSATGPPFPARPPPCSHRWPSTSPPTVAGHTLTDLAESPYCLRYLLHDRNSRYTQAFDTVFTADDIEILNSAPQTPRMNAHAERFVRTIRAECTTGC